MSKFGVGMYVQVKGNKEIFKIIPANTDGIVEPVGVLIKSVMDDTVQPAMFNTLVEVHPVDWITCVAPRVYYPYNYLYMYQDGQKVYLHGGKTLGDTFVPLCVYNEMFTAKAVSIMYGIPIMPIEVYSQLIDSNPYRCAVYKVNDWITYSGGIYRIIDVFADRYTVKTPEGNYTMTLYFTSHDKIRLAKLKDWAGDINCEPPFKCILVHKDKFVTMYVPGSDDNSVWYAMKRYALYEAKALASHYRMHIMPEDLCNKYYEEGAMKCAMS